MLYTELLILSDKAGT